MKLFLYLLIALGLVLPQVTFAQDGEAVATNMARYWAGKAQQQRSLKMFHRQRRTRRRNRRLPRGTFIPPWVAYKEDDAATEEAAESDSDAETPNAEGKKELELEDLQLWTSMDLDKDGKLTVAEFERFSRSPNAQAFVRQMKAQRAVEDWAQKLGIDAAKAKQAMMVGAQAQRRRNMMTQQYYQRVNAHRRRAAIARRNQQVYARRQRQQNYWSRLGQQYYAAMRRQGRRREEL